MRTLILFAALAVTLAVAAFAADPPAAGPAFMARAPAADIVVEDTEGGARLVFSARDPKELAALRAWTRELATHLKDGCPMADGARGHGPGHGRGAQACPRMNAAPPAP